MKNNYEEGQFSCVRSVRTIAVGFEADDLLEFFGFITDKLSGHCGRSIWQIQSIFRSH